MRGLGNRPLLSLEPGRILESAAARLSPEEQEGGHSHAVVFEKIVPFRRYLTQPHRQAGGQEEFQGSWADPNQVGGEPDSPGQEGMGGDRAVTRMIRDTATKCLLRQHLEGGPTEPRTVVTHTLSCWLWSVSDANPGLLRPREALNCLGARGAAGACVSLQTQILGAAASGLPSALVDLSLLCPLLFQESLYSWRLHGVYQPQGHPGSNPRACKCFPLWDM